MNILKFLITSIILIFLFNIISKSNNYVNPKDKFNNLNDDNKNNEEENKKKNNKQNIKNNINKNIPKKIKFMDNIDINDFDVHDYFLRNKIINEKSYKINEESYKDDRNNFINFRSYINQTSKGDDPVDRINHLYLSGKGDLSKNLNNTIIKDLFNDITKNDYKNFNLC